MHCDISSPEQIVQNAHVDKRQTSQLEAVEIRALVFGSRRKRSTEACFSRHLDHFTYLSFSFFQDTNLPNCAILDNYSVDKPVWTVDLSKETDISGVVVLTWQGAGQGKGK